MCLTVNSMPSADSWRLSAATLWATKGPSGREVWLAGCVVVDMVFHGDAEAAQDGTPARAL